MELKQHWKDFIAELKERGTPFGEWCEWWRKEQKALFRCMLDKKPHFVTMPTTITSEGFSGKKRYYFDNDGKQIDKKEYLKLTNVL